MEICSIKLQLNNGQAFEVSIKDARELYEQLHSLFGGRQSVREWDGLRAAERQYVSKELRADTPF